MKLFKYLTDIYNFLNSYNKEDFLIFKKSEHELVLLKRLENNKIFYNSQIYDNDFFYYNKLESFINIIYDLRNRYIEEQLNRLFDDIEANDYENILNIIPLSISEEKDFFVRYDINHLNEDEIEGLNILQYEIFKRAYSYNFVYPYNYDLLNTDIAIFNPVLVKDLLPDWLYVVGWKAIKPVYPTFARPVTVLYHNDYRRNNLIPEELERYKTIRVKKQYSKYFIEALNIVYKDKPRETFRSYTYKPPVLKKPKPKRQQLDFDPVPPEIAARQDAEGEHTRARLKYEKKQKRVEYWSKRFSEEPSDHILDKLSYAEEALEEAAKELEEAKKKADAAYYKFVADEKKEIEDLAAENAKILADAAAQVLPPVLIKEVSEDIKSNSLIRIFAEIEFDIEKENLKSFKLKNYVYLNKEDIIEILKIQKAKAKLRAEARLKLEAEAEVKLQEEAKLEAEAQAISKFHFFIFKLKSKYKKKSKKEEEMELEAKIDAAAENYQPLLNEMVVTDEDIKRALDMLKYREKLEEKRAADLDARVHHHFQELLDARQDLYEWIIQDDVRIAENVGLQKAVIFYYDSIFERDKLLDYNIKETKKLDSKIRHLLFGPPKFKEYEKSAIFYYKLHTRTDEIIEEEVDKALDAITSDATIEQERSYRERCYYTLVQDKFERLERLKKYDDKLFDLYESLCKLNKELFKLFLGGVTLDPIYKIEHDPYMEGLRCLLKWIEKYDERKKFNEFDIYCKTNSYHMRYVPYNEIYNKDYPSDKKFKTSLLHDFTDEEIKENYENMINKEKTAIDKWNFVMTNEKRRKAVFDFFTEIDYMEYDEESKMYPNYYWEEQDSDIYTENKVLDKTYEFLNNPQYILLMPLLDAFFEIFRKKGWYKKDKSFCEYSPGIDQRMVFKHMKIFDLSYERVYFHAKKDLLVDDYLHLDYEELEEEVENDQFFVFFIGAVIFIWFFVATIYYYLVWFLKLDIGYPHLMMTSYYQAAMDKYLEMLDSIKKNPYWEMQEAYYDFHHLHRNRARFRFYYGLELKRARLRYHNYPLPFNYVTYDIINDKIERYKFKRKEVLNDNYYEGFGILERIDTFLESWDEGGKELTELNYKVRKFSRKWELNVRIPFIEDPLAREEQVWYRINQWFIQKVANAYQGAINFSIRNHVPEKLESFCNKYGGIISDFYNKIYNMAYEKLLEIYNNIVLYYYNMIYTFYYNNIYIHYYNYIYSPITNYLLQYEFCQKLNNHRIYLSNWMKERMGEYINEKIKEEAVILKEKEELIKRKEELKLQEILKEKAEIKKRHDYMKRLERIRFNTMVNRYRRRLEIRETELFLEQLHLRPKSKNYELLQRRRAGLKKVVKILRNKNENNTY